LTQNIDLQTKVVQKFIVFQSNCKTFYKIQFEYHELKQNLKVYIKTNTKFWKKCRWL